MVNSPRHRETQSGLGDSSSGDIRNGVLLLSLSELISPSFSRLD